MKINMQRKLIKTAQLAALWFVVVTVNPTVVQAHEPVSGASGRLNLVVQENKVDSRVLKLEKYLIKHNSPLAENAHDFVDAADKYNLGENWALVAAIAGNESTFGKHIPPASHNAWGWGIPTGARSGIGFKSWKDGIYTVTKGLSEKYIAKGADTPEKMAPIYAPPSRTWGRNVRWFMNQIEATPIEPEITI